MRGMALVNEATLIAELGDLSRFANPRQFMAYFGLVPCEHSSGASLRRGGITKAGNNAYLACPSDRPNHIGIAVQRHLRAGRIQERDGKLYATSPAAHTTA
jgi:Transposase IS116/IS110/IS902 family